MNQPAAGQRRSPSLRIILVEFLPSGGMFQFSFQLGEALADAGNDVELVTGRNPELHAQRGLRVLELLPTWNPTRQETLPPALRRIRRAHRAALLVESWRRGVTHVRRVRPDVVQFGELRFPLDSVGLRAVAWLGRSAVADMAHNPLPYDVSSGSRVEKSDIVTRRLLDAAYRSCAVIFTLGEGPRTQLVEMFPRVREVVVCGHGEYNAFTSDLAVLVPASGAPERVLFFGSWTRYKNLTLLLESFRLVRAERPNAELLVTGPVMADVDLGALTQLAATIPGVELRPGYVARNDVAGVLASSRVVALPYEVVNISGVVHLAHTFERPVVATDVGSMRDVVEDGKSGRLCAATPESFAAGLIEILSDPAGADRMGAYGARKLAAESSWTKVAARVSKAYQEVLG